MTHGHSHHDVPIETTLGRRRSLIGIVVVLAVATIVGIVVLWPSGDIQRSDEQLGLVSDVYAAEVTAVTPKPCAGTSRADGVPCDRIRFRLSEGPDDGSVRSIELPDSATSPDFAVGDQIVLSYDPRADPDFRYQFSDRQRRPVLLWLTVVFVVVVVALGRLRGAAALLGLGASFVVLLEFVLPALVQGESPEAVAIVGSSAIAYLALYLAHGFRMMTAVALLGTLSALALTVGLATLFTEFAQLTGFTSEEAILVLVGTQNLDLGGIVLAGMVLGALGALDDVTVTQASTVWELRNANPDLPRWDLYRRGLRVGRDHVGSTVNTLALAYAGAALPLLLLFVLANQSLGTIANSEIVATEIIRTLVGSIGLVSAVPLTTWLAVEFVSGQRAEPSVRRRRSASDDEPHAPGPIEAADRDEGDFWD